MAAEVDGDSGIRGLTIIPKAAKPITTIEDHVVEEEEAVAAGERRFGIACPT